VRIVSLLPSATEIVCALGLRDRLVARSHECDWPPDVAALPAVTRPRIAVDGTAREIHDRVTALSESVDGVYALDVPALAALAPTHVVTQAQCDVCAVGLGDVERALASWRKDRPAVVALHPASLEAALDDIRRTGAFLSARAEADRLIAGIAARFEAVRLRAGAGSRPRVACLEWTEPLMGAGNWIPELVRIAGGDPVIGVAGRHSAWISEDDLEAADPDVIVVVPCGFPLDRAAAELRALAARPRFRALRAIRSGCVFAADGNAYFNRPGPRLADSAEILSGILRGDAAGPEGAWMSLAEASCGFS
jgi:iron complex transport system substrate-binding protein